MATVNFLYRSVRDRAPLSLRLLYRHQDKDLVYGVKTRLLIEKKHWSDYTINEPKRDSEIKARRADISNNIQELENYILDSFSNADPNQIDKTWLTDQLDLFYNPNKRAKERSELLTDNIQYLIDSAGTRANDKGTDEGLSNGRIKTYKALKVLIAKYQKDLGSAIKVSDVDLQFSKDFLDWMKVDQSYSTSYSNKKLSDIKVVCNDAKIYGVPVNSQLQNIKIPRATKNPIIYLTPNEIEKIRKLKLSSKSLINTKRWILLGCAIGQRGDDLINIDENNFSILNNLQVIRLTQKKGDKKVIIPVMEEVREIYQEGLPYKISLKELNKNVKTVCFKAGLTQKIKGRLYDADSERKIAGSFEKWKLITTHCFRRSFASNLYGKIPTVLIMQVTGHGSEGVLLKYIGQTPLDYAQQIADAMNSINQFPVSQLKINTP